MSSAQILSTVKDGHTQKVSHINSWRNLVCTGAINRHCSGQLSCQTEKTLECHSPKLDADFLNDLYHAAHNNSIKNDPCATPPVWSTVQRLELAQVKLS